MTSWPNTALDSQSSLTLLITSSQNVLDVESEICQKIIRAIDKHITKIKVIWKIVYLLLDCTSLRSQLSFYVLSNSTKLCSFRPP